MTGEREGCQQLSWDLRKGHLRLMPENPMCDHGIENNRVCAHSQRTGGRHRRNRHSVSGLETIGWARRHESPCDSRSHSHEAGSSQDLSPVASEIDSKNEMNERLVQRIQTTRRSGKIHA